MAGGNANLHKWYNELTTVEPVFIVKVLLVLFIVTATFYDLEKHLKFLDNKTAKILLLVIIIATLVSDLHTGIILLVAFLLLMVQFNSSIVDNIRNKNIELFLSYRPASIDNKDSDVEELKSDDKIIQCDNKKKNEISECIVKRNLDTKSNVDYAIDHKVKPYEVFLKMITTQEHLDKASNSAFLSAQH